MAGSPDHPKRRPAVIAGASSGIGQATAVTLARAGHPVILGARRVERCEETAEAIRVDGGEAAALRLDVTDAASVAAFVKAAEAAFGDLEVLVWSAGDILPAAASETDPDAFAAQVEVNLLGAHRLTSLILSPMIERRRGDVIFVTSDAVRWPRPRVASYVTSKWGLEGLARAMQMELEGTGVRASIVRPGPTLTGMGMAWDPTVLGEVLEEWRRWGLVRHDGYLRPEDVAGAIATVVATPRGTHLTLVEIEPEAPTRQPKGERQ
jgi:NADP-dependent 3-hydroxy acid dehydrogenase YdfG